MDKEHEVLLMAYVKLQFTLDKILRTKVKVVKCKGNNNNNNFKHKDDRENYAQGFNNNNNFKHKGDRENYAQGFNYVKLPDKKGLYKLQD